MPHYPDEIEYSEKRQDSSYEYRHVILPKHVAKEMFKIANCKRLLTNDEVRSLGVCQSPGWEHYMIHNPEPHILLFRRPLSTDPQTGDLPTRVGNLRRDGTAETLALVQCNDKADHDAERDQRVRAQALAQLAEAKARRLSVENATVHAQLDEAQKMLEQSSGDLQTVPQELAIARQAHGSHVCCLGVRNTARSAHAGAGGEPVLCKAVASAPSKVLGHCKRKLVAEARAINVAKCSHSKVKRKCAICTPCPCTASLEDTAKRRRDLCADCTPCACTQVLPKGQRIRAGKCADCLPCQCTMHKPIGKRVLKYRCKTCKSK